MKRLLVSLLLTLGAFARGVEVETIEKDLQLDSDFDACVSLLIYSDNECQSDPVKVVTFSTWSKRGSPCYHDATMPYYSAKNQRCDLFAGTWHQEIYLFSQTCETTWYSQLFSPQYQVFSVDNCVYGYKLDYCVAGPCPDDQKQGEIAENF